MVHVVDSRAPKSWQQLSRPTSGRLSEDLVTQQNTHTLPSFLRPSIPEIQNKEDVQSRYLWALQHMYQPSYTLLIW